LEHSVVLRCGLKTLMIVIHGKKVRNLKVSKKGIRPTTRFVTFLIRN